ncbi:MAG: insulinase family protein [Paraglaciecola sp.]|nr:insulinase family protein [Paraglaciecola sp.]NCT49793.1 insulinase family protein [Paraglaciecola sp.]
MKMTFNLCSLWLLLTSINSVFAADFTLPPYQKTVFKNGLVVYLLEQHEVTLIDVSIVVKAGAVSEQTSGLAKLTAEHLLLGTQDMKRPEFEQQLEFIGADIRASADLESAYVSVSFAKTDLQQVLPLIGASVLHPAFDEQEFAAQKQRALAQLKQKTESPRANIRDYFNKLLFRDHPYAHNVDGDLVAVEKMTLAEVKDFHERWYKPTNAAVVVTGDFESQKMLVLLHEIFDKWQGTTAEMQPLTSPPSPQESYVLLVNKEDATESTFLIGGLGIARNNQDFVAVSVVNTILGGRFTSWLNDALRVNSGLTYGAGSRFTSMKEAGSFGISTFTKTSTTIEAIDLALLTYERLWQEGLDEATLASAKAYVNGQFPPQYETSADLNNLLSDMFIFGFDEKFINTFVDEVESVTTERSKSIINQYFPRKNLQFVVIGQAQAIRQALQKYGKIIEIDITDVAVAIP